MEMRNSSELFQMGRPMIRGRGYAYEKETYHSGQYGDCTIGDFCGDCVEQCV